MRPDPPLPCFSSSDVRLHGVRSPVQQQTGADPSHEGAPRTDNVPYLRQGALHRGPPTASFGAGAQLGPGAGSAAGTNGSEGAVHRAADHVDEANDGGARGWTGGSSRTKTGHKSRGAGKLGAGRVTRASRASRERTAATMAGTGRWPGAGRRVGAGTWTRAAARADRRPRKGGECVPYSDLGKASVKRMTAGRRRQITVFYFVVHCERHTSVMSAINMT